MSIKDELIRAKAVIEDPRNWTRGAFAVNEKGEGCSAVGDTACSFCALGAMLRVNASRNAMKHLVRTSETLPGGYVTIINDDMGHEAVMKLFDVAIESAP